MYKTLWKELMREIKYNFLHWGPFVTHYRLSQEEINSFKKLKEGEDFKKGLAGHLKDEYEVDKNIVFTLIQESEIFNVRYQHKPFMVWIWISIVLLAFGGAFAIFKNEKKN